MDYISGPVLQSQVGMGISVLRGHTSLGGDLCPVVLQTSMSVDHPHQWTAEALQTARTRKGATTAHAAQAMSLFLGQRSSGMRVRTHVEVRMRLRFPPLVLEVWGLRR